MSKEKEKRESESGSMIKKKKKKKRERQREPHKSLSDEAQNLNTQFLVRMGIEKERRGLELTR